MMQYFLTGNLLVMILLASCNGPKKENVIVADHCDTIKLEQAKGFTIVHSGNQIELAVENPWQHASGVVYTYLLSDNGNQPNTIKIPVKKVICLSTTHIAYIDKLGESSTITGVTNGNYITNQLINQQIHEGKTKDVGNDQALNYELILKLRPDIIFAYGVGAEVATTYQKFAEWGIPVIMVSEYLEETPLAKAEWIKFFSCFYQRERKADSIYSDISKQYNQLKELPHQCETQPKVLSSLPWKDVWYVPGGDSYMAHFIEDAGADYLWKNNHSRESLFLSIEEVFNTGQQAEFWINTGMADRLDDIRKADPRMTKLSPYIHKKVFNNNRSQSSSGGNDFYESGVINPQKILHDLLLIFHPELINDTTFTYYKKLE